jgi:alpha-mannosidase
MENIRRLNMESVTAINQLTEPLKAHIPVTVFNSNQGLTTFPVEFECMSDYRPFWEGEWTLKLFDRQGNEIPCQEEQPAARLPFHRWRRKISFLAQNTPPGIHHFYLKPIPSLTPSPTPESPPSELGILNSNLDFPPLTFLVLSDTADSWGTNTHSWREVTGRFEPEYPERIIEQGPIRTIHESGLTYHHSKITVHRITYPDWPVTEYKIRIQWNEEQHRLKLAIPTSIENPRLIAQIPGGSEEFPADSQEYVHGTWMTLQPPVTLHASRITSHSSLVTGHSSLHIAHSGLHGFDFDGSEVRLSVLRSAAYCHEQGYDLNNGRTHAFMDIGIHEIRLAVWVNGDHPERIAEWLNAPPLVWPHLPIG